MKISFWFGDIRYSFYFTKDMNLIEILTCLDEQYKFEELRFKKSFKRYINYSKLLGGK